MRISDWSSDVCSSDLLVPVGAAFDQVEHRQSVNDDEVRPAGLAHAAHDFHREAHAVFRAAAPAVVALVGARNRELVEQVALRAHHLDAVVAALRSEEHTTELQSLMRISYAVFCLKKKNKQYNT